MQMEGMQYLSMRGYHGRYLIPRAELLVRFAIGILYLVLQGHYSLQVNAYR